MAAGLDLETTSLLSNTQRQQALPTIHAYQMIMKCKTLGIRVDSKDIDIQTLDNVYEFYVKTHEIESKRRK